MAESVYKFIEIAGSSTESWEKAAVAAVETAASSLNDLRVAEVLEQDMTIEKWQSQRVSDQTESLLQIPNRLRSTAAVGTGEKGISTRRTPVPPPLTLVVVSSSLRLHG